MFIFKKQESHVQLIPLENSNIITKLGESIATDLSHNISHTLSEESIKISYTLKMRNGCHVLLEAKIFECVANFLLFYIAPNFVLPLSSYSSTDKQLIAQNFKSCEICINNDQPSITINPTKILHLFNLEDIILLETFNDTLTTLISNAIKYTSKPLEDQLTISFNVVLNMHQGFSITELNKTLRKNTELTKQIAKLYHIVKICNNFPTTNIFPGIYKEKLKVITAHSKRSGLSICLKTNEKDLSGFQISTMLLNLLSDNQYKYDKGFQVYTLITKKIDDLPNIQEHDLQHSNQHDRRLHKTTHKVTCDGVKVSQIYYNIDQYISFIHIIFNSKDRIKVSVEMSLKKDIQTEEELTETFEFKDLTVDTRIKQELYDKIYFKDKSPGKITRFLRGAVTFDSQMAPLFQYYDVYIHAEIPYNMIPQALTNIPIRPVNPPIVLEIEPQSNIQDQSPDIESTPHIQTSDIPSTSAIPGIQGEDGTDGNQDQSSATKLTPQSKTLKNDVLSVIKTANLPLPMGPLMSFITEKSRPTDEEQSQATGSTSQNQSLETTATTKSAQQPSIRPSLKKEKSRPTDTEEQPPVTESTSQSQSLENTTTTQLAQQPSPIPPIVSLTDTKRKESQTAKKIPPLNKSYNTQIISAVVCISILTIASIIGQYILTNKLLANNPKLLDINIIITVGIIFCFTSILLGIIINYKMESSYNLRDSTLELPAQDNQQCL